MAAESGGTAPHAGVHLLNGITGARRHVRPACSQQVGGLVCRSLGQDHWTEDTESQKATQFQSPIEVQPPGQAQPSGAQRRSSGDDLAGPWCHGGLPVHHAAL